MHKTPGAQRGSTGAPRWAVGEGLCLLDEAQPSGVGRVARSRCPGGAVHDQPPQISSLVSCAGLVLLVHQATIWMVGESREWTTDMNTSLTDRLAGRGRRGDIVQEAF